MKRLRSITRGVSSASIAPEVGLTFIRDILDLLIPILTNKNPRNPVNGGGGGGGSA